MKRRAARGNILLMVFACICFVVVPVLIILCESCLQIIARTRAQSVIEAACLVAANDLSKIIVEDDDFGLVSLSNYPPIGKGTCAPDGEPRPVTGINTLVATVRQNAILAQELENSTLMNLVDKDREALVDTIKNLNSTISKSLDGDTKEKFVDIQGNTVNPLEDVRAFLKVNLPDNIQVVSVKLVNGWLDGEGETTIGVPHPATLAQLKPGTEQNGSYRAFINIPANHRNFNFAGVGIKSSLVNQSAFRAADKKHICSIVKIECVLKIDNFGLVKIPFKEDQLCSIYGAACGQPYAMADNGPKGLLTLRFTGGRVQGLRCWKDFFNHGTFHDNKVTTYEVAGGDYPTDKEARMVQNFPEQLPNTAQQFAEHYYYWLRNGHAQPKLDAILAMLEEPFQSGPAEIYAYEFKKDGGISRRIIARDPFPISVTAENQFSTIADTTLQGGITPIIIFRNDVKNLSLAKGGKHCGQPLTGYPLNWCELPEYGGDEHVAVALGKGRLGTHLTVIDPRGTAQPDEAINDPNFSLFKTFDGSTLFLQPRRSFYSGGLALDIEIGGTSAAEPPTQENASWSKLPGKRLI